MSIYLSVYVNFNQEPPTNEYGVWKKDCEDWNSPEGANYRMNTNISFKNGYDTLSKEQAQFLLDLIAHENNLIKTIWCVDDVGFAPDFGPLEELDIMELEIRLL